MLFQFKDFIVGSLKNINVLSCKIFYFNLIIWNKFKKNILLQKCWIIQHFVHVDEIDVREKKNV